MLQTWTSPRLKIPHSTYFESQLHSTRSMASAHEKRCVSCSVCTSRTKRRKAVAVARRRPSGEKCASPLSSSESENWMLVLVMRKHRKRNHAREKRFVEKV